MIHKVDLHRDRPVVPVALDLAHVSLLASGRIRALVLPLPAYEALRPEDLLWVQESIRVEVFPSRPRQFRVRYPGNHLATFVDVPEGGTKPPAGFHSAARMPVECSRWTLRVLEADRRRLRSLGDGEATECGCQPLDGGWGPPGVLTDSFRPYRASWSAVGHMVGPEYRTSASQRDPWLLFVRFEAIARNFRRVIGLHSVGGSDS